MTCSLVLCVSTPFSLKPCTPIQHFTVRHQQLSCINRIPHFFYQMLVNKPQTRAMLLTSILIFSLCRSACLAAETTSSQIPVGSRHSYLSCCRSLSSICKICVLSQTPQMFSLLFVITESICNSFFSALGVISTPLIYYFSFHTLKLAIHLGIGQKRMHFVIVEYFLFLNNST